MATIRKKRKEPVSVFQRDPGPWSRLLINWLATLAVIMVFGLVMLFSASYTTGYLRMGDSFHYIKQQALCMLIGLGCMFAMSYVDHRFLRRMVVPGYLIVLAMLAVTLTMAPLNGCRRWIRFGGFTLQSSEVAKFEMILLCSSLAAKAPQVEKLSPGKMVIMNFREWLHVRVWKQLVIPVLPLIPVIALLALEPHMSGIVLTVAVVGTILLLSGSGGILTWVGAGTAGLMLETLLSHVDSIPYLQDRLDGWTQDLSKMTDQTVQSLYAIGSGGLTGLGLGNSVEKQLWLPESTNDFIFSVVCEELGFVGAVLIIVLFVLFIVQGLWIAYRAENLYCTMVGIGIMAQIAWQVFCNIAVVTNTLPNTGISLPFFSSGGTSLILLLAEMGVMVNIGRNGERAAQQREALRAQHEAAKAEQEAARREKTIVLADARAARAEQQRQTGGITMRVLIAAGGTAGHINPALAIAGALKKADPTAEIHFAGRKEGMEYRLVTQAGYPFHHIEITGFQRKLSLHNIKRNIVTLWNLALSGPKAKAIMKEIQPDLVIGCGGYVSGPVVRCAAKMGIHTALHEQNAFPGVTNKLLAPDVDIVFAAVPAAVEKLGAPQKTIVVGNPVRPEVFTQAKNRDAIRAQLGAGDRTVILSFGGSLGARRINEVVGDLCAWEQHEHKPVLHLHATGQYGVQLFKDLEQQKGFAEGDSLVVKEYINNMPELLAAADLVISRAGALTLAELEAVGRAAVLIPSPNVAENHQYYNAMELQKAGAAVVIEEKDLTGEKLVQTVSEMLTQPGKLAEMGRNARSLSVDDSLDRIAAALLELVKKA